MWRKIMRPSDFKYKWWDCSTEIVCSCGESKYVTDEDGSVECGCGRTYRLVAYLEVWEGEDG